MALQDDLLKEVRRDVKLLTASFQDFKGRVVMKEELELWQEAQQTTRRWAIGTVLTMITIAIAVVAVVVTI